MSQFENVSVFIVPGSWHVPEHYSLLIKELNQNGISVSTLLLPTCNLSNAPISDLQHPDLAGPRPPTPWPDMYDDAAAVHKGISSLVEDGKLVLVAAHSYGGLPASEAVSPELCLKARKADNKPGGVIGFFAIASFFLPVGMTTLQAVGGTPLPTTPEQPSGLHIVVDPKENLFNELPPSEQDHWTSLLRPQSWIVHETPLRQAGYLHVPCAYLKTQKDRMTPLQGQEMGISIARQMGVSIKEYTIDEGHDPFLRQPAVCAGDIVDFTKLCLETS